MKFNLNDFLQLDTNGLLAVNGGSGCSSGPSSSSSGSSGGSSSSGNSSVSSSGSGSSTTETVYVPTGPCNGYLVTRTKKRGNNGTSSGTVSSSGGGSCSSSCEGVASTTYQTGSSSSSGGHGCSGGGSSAPSGGNNGGGTCSAGTQTPPVENPSTEKTSGKFAQITDGSYADNLTMQFYKKLGTVKGMEYDSAMNDGKEQNGNVIDFLFSSTGCLMAGTAKIASEATGQNISLLDINQKVDTNSDGLLSVNEITAGLNLFLDEKFGDMYDVAGKNIENPTLDTLRSLENSNVNNTTYVLGFAPDCYGGHWIVLEGYNTDSTGKISFSYDGTSDNDVGRQYVLGMVNQDTDNKVYGINRIETYTIYKK